MLEATVDKLLFLLTNAIWVIGILGYLYYKEREKKTPKKLI